MRLQIGVPSLLSTPSPEAALAAGGAASRRRPAGPLATPGVPARTAPFAVVALIGAVIAVIETDRATWAAWAGHAILLSAGVLAYAAPWRRLPVWAQATPSMVFLGGVALLRHASGDDGSPLAVLVLIPVLWLTLYGTSAQAWAAVAAAAAALLVPMAVWGAPEYDGELSEVVLYTLLSAAVVLTGRRLIKAVNGSEAAFRLMTETATDVVCRVDPQGRFAYVSPSVQAVLGLMPSDLVGRPVLELVHPDDRADMAEAQAALARGELRSIAAQWRCRHRDGRWVWIETSVRNVLDADGRIVETHLSGRDVTSRQQAEAERDRLIGELGQQALEDPLTSLLNRRGWDTRATAELRRAARNGTALTLVVLDLDRFKAFNDAHGHAAGDALLRDAAHAWRGELRAYDVLARLGGDEFALALPDSTVADAVALVDRLRARILDGVGCSAGVVGCGAVLSLDEAVQRADAALYAAKAAGGGRTEVAERYEPPRHRSEE